MGARPISAARFAAAMESVLLGASLPKKVCIAVSGGVDSMALTYLSCQYFLPRGTDVTGLIVDHDLRQGSSKEAKEVGRLVKEFGANSRVLKMKWTDKERQNMARFEVNAREKRLQLLSEAVRFRGNVEHLLFAHTLDDQLETLLLRLTRGSSIRGLAGMKEVSSYWEAPPPGQGTLKLVRPLLRFNKAELYETCIANKVKWYEDSTNHDPEFTIRNSIREFLKDEDKLPQAFRRAQLMRSLSVFQRKRRKAERDANEVFELLLKTGKAHIDEQHARLTFIEFPGFDVVDTSVLALALQRLVARIIPSKDAGYQFSQFERIAARMQQALERRPDLDPATRGKAPPVKFNVSGLSWHLSLQRYAHIQGGPKTTLYKWTVSRQLPNRLDKDRRLPLQATSQWSHWKLFDKRYWVRVRDGSLENEPEGTFRSVLVKLPHFPPNDLEQMQRFVGPQVSTAGVSPYEVLTQPCFFKHRQTNTAPTSTKHAKGGVEADENYTVVGTPLLFGPVGGASPTDDLEIEIQLKADPEQEGPAVPSTAPPRRLST